MNVLIADGELRLRKVLSLYLGKHGHTIIETSNGRDALRLAEQEKPDVIILNSVMPGLSGIDVTTAIKESSAARNIPVIMLSANVSSADVDAALKAGVSNYITKPFSPKDLLDTMILLQQ